ncbi:MFS transporter [Humibacter ginsenosidimutans]|uniref:MFS transporter n=1 Tax=Humibacter ginsenosidimutans TaxID=2599293 RepID=A0A5B8M595_9MICO|nr:MFS transporter [Humibacter ginsenosidimutans]QDZ15361.1 MFS transporter [Humibacter ginsenosidimutans]
MRQQRLGAPFAVFLTAETVSAAGSMVTMVALPLVAVQQLHASTLTVGLLEAVQWIPSVFLGLLLGALVDRNQRRCRSMMVAADIGRACTLGTIPLAGAFGMLTLPFLLVAATLTGFFTAFFQAAYAPYLRQLLPSDLFSAGNGYLQSGRSAARIAGPSLAGALVAIVGASTTITVDALSFILCSVALLTIAAPYAPPDAGARRSIRADIAEGLSTLRTNSLLAAITTGAATANLFITAIGALEIVFLVRSAHLAPTAVGIVLTVGGIGGLAGALLSRGLNDRYGLGRIAILAFLATAPAALLLPITQTGAAATLFAIGVCAISFGISLGSVALTTLRLQHTPQRLQGRVSAVSQVLNAATIPLGALLGGVSGQYLGTRVALAVLAIGYIAFSIVFSRSPLRTADRLSVGS